jgi:hypothetical protein
MWVFLAFVVWLAAGVMYIARGTRYLSRPLCFAMAGTFPVVFAYQIIAAPFVAGALIANWAFLRILEPGASTTTENPVIIVISIGAALLSGGLMLVMSFAGFYEGWRIGWAFAKGRQFREVVWEASTTGLLRRVTLRVLRTRLTSP